MINLKVAPDASGKKVRLLPVGGLLSRENACVANLFGRCSDVSYN